MNGLSEVYIGLSDAMAEVHEHCWGQGGAPYLGCALYLPERGLLQRGFSVVHYNVDQPTQHRSDAYIDRRLLTPDDSVGVGALFGGDDLSVSASLMFPNLHQCVHIPLENAEGHRVGLLQVIFDSATSPDESDLLRWARERRQAPQIKGLVQPAQNLFTLTKGDQGNMLALKPPYNPDRIIFFVDITGSTAMAMDNGAYHTNDFLKGFCLDYVRPLAQACGADLCRTEGDGVWLSLPATALEQAEKLARELIDGYEGYISQTIFPFAHGSFLKIAMEVGELDSLYWLEKDHPSPVDRSGPVFTGMKQVFTDMAHRQSHEIFRGPLLRGVRKGLAMSHMYDQGYVREEVVLAV